MDHYYFKRKLNILTKKIIPNRSWSLKIQDIPIILVLIAVSCQKNEDHLYKEENLTNNGSLKSIPLVVADEFTIAVIGDTQNFVDFGNNPSDHDCQTLAPFDTMINWIVTNRQSENIKYVASVGDITDNYGSTTSESTGQWQRAHDSYEVLKTAGVPFGVVPGNHDIYYASGGNYPNNGTTFPPNPNFHPNFGRPQFWSLPNKYNMAGFPNSYSNQNHYDVINTPAGEFMIIYFRWHHMESEADPVIVWAKSMIELPENANKRIIAVTHYVAGRHDDDEDGKNDWGRQGYQIPGYSQANKIYDALKHYPNFFMFLGGHVPGEYERQDTFGGNIVHSLTTDFSKSPGCGSGTTVYPEGVLRTMTFSLSRDLITFKTFLPGQENNPIRTFTKPWYRSFTTSRTNDYNNDGHTDPAFFDNGTWTIHNLPNQNFGNSSSIPVPGDYDGNGETETAYFNPGNWTVKDSSAVTIGLTGDVPVPGDYDGNGTTDIAVFRPSEGKFYVRMKYLKNGSYWRNHTLGNSNSIPVPMDYDGDGKVDYAVFDPNTAIWNINGVSNSQYGLSGDIPVPGDYNGEGRNTRAVYRPSNNGWYVYGSSNNPVTIGQSGDIPVPGDYDGNGSTDIAVYRPSTGEIFINGQGTISTGVLNAKPLNLPYNIIKFFFP